MGKVKKVKCEVAGCSSGEDGGPFVTDEECTSVAERTAELKEHVYQVHTIAVDNIKAEAAKTTAEAAKKTAEAALINAEKSESRRSGSSRGEKKAIMQRPMIEESVSESDWSFFLADWDRYVEATDLAEDGEAAVRHLWQACSDGHFTMTGPGR